MEVRNRANEVLQAKAADDRRSPAIETLRIVILDHFKRILRVRGHLRIYTMA